MMCEPSIWGRRLEDTGSDPTGATPRSERVDGLGFHELRDEQPRTGAGKPRKAALDERVVPLRVRSRIREVAERRRSMLNLITASAYFLLIHFGVSGTRLRDRLVTRLGAGPYRGVFALASVIGLVWMVYAYRHAPMVELWGVVLGFRPAAYVLVFIAFLFVVVGITMPSPTRVGMESKVRQGAEAARGMVRITRHPFLWGVALWALVHLIVNGDLASLILFGSLLALALGSRLSI